MSSDLYIKERLSDRRRRRVISFPLVIAIILVILAAVFAIFFNRSKPDTMVDELQVEPIKSESSDNNNTRAPASANDTDDDTRADRGEAKPANAAVVDMLRNSESLVEAGNLLEARTKLLQVLKSSDNRVALTKAKNVLNKIDIDLLLSPRKMPGKVVYMVKSGDSLDRIARKQGANIELIQKSNDIKGALIHPGQRLLIPSGDFSILVDKSDNILTVFYNGEYLKSYLVGTGKHDKTPAAESKITDRIIHPTWWRPDGKAIPYGSPDNLLGTHWLALDIRGYGIHGTWEPDTIGKHESAGCIRMHNKDIEELYTIIPIGTPVTIQE